MFKSASSAVVWCSELPYANRGYSRIFRIMLLLIVGPSRDCRNPNKPEPTEMNRFLHSSWSYKTSVSTSAECSELCAHSSVSIQLQVDIFRAQIKPIENVWWFLNNKKKRHAKFHVSFDNLEDFLVESCMVAKLKNHRFVALARCKLERVWMGERGWWSNERKFNC